MLQRYLGVSYFSLEVVGLDIGILYCIMDEGVFIFPYYGLFKLISFPVDLFIYLFLFIYKLCIALV